MWPFSSDSEDSMTTSSDSDSWNNLNIPPDGSSSWFARVGQLFFFLGPAALAYVHLRDKQQRQLEGLSAEKRDQEVKLLMLTDMQKKLKRSKDRFIVMEEAKATRILKRLDEVEREIKDFLDIRCSVLNPWKTRHHRQVIEDKLLKAARDEDLIELRLEEGIQQVIMYDYLHCAEHYNLNGQIYRVWMKHWRELVQNEKNKRIARHLDSMLDDVTKNS